MLESENGNGLYMDFCYSNHEITQNATRGKEQHQRTGINCMLMKTKTLTASDLAN